MMDSFEMISNDSFSWPTRLSRTRISSVQGLGLGQEPDPIIHSLDDVLRTVQRVGAKRCLYSDIETIARVGEGSSFNVDHCVYEKKVVAVKHIKIGRVENGRNRLNSRLRRVLNEVRIMCHTPLREHPNILSMIGYGWRSTVNGTLPYIVVEYADHGSLRHYLKETPRVLRTKIILAGDVAAGLNALHQCGIVHGDLKLDNVVVMKFWNRPGRVIAKLCDFGHSIVLSSDKKHLKYYGTPLYNPPEVDFQDTCPIDANDLPKCDIWAYALSLWEILSDGATYFQDSWRSQETHRRKLSDTFLLDGTGSTEYDNVDIDCTPDSSAQSSIKTKVSASGSFDTKQLSGLADQFLKSINFGSAFIDKAVLRKLLSRALQVDPKDRPAKITLGPLMGNWNPADVNTLLAKLAIHTGTSQWSCDMLRPDQEKEIMWEHQVQILNDFEQIAKRETSDGEMASANFQVAMCHMSGFGTVKQRAIAAWHLMEAEERSHLPAKLFGPHLRYVLMDAEQGSLTDYDKVLIRGFRFSGPEPLAAFTVQWLSEGPTSPSIVEKHDATIMLPQYEVLAGQTLCAENSVTKTFPCYAELKNWITKCAQSSTEPLVLRPETLVTTTPPTNNMNLLESAVLQNDGDLVSLLLASISPTVPGYVGDNPLILAIRQGNMDQIQHMLRDDEKPFTCNPDGSSLLHWLFMLGTDVRFISNLIRQKLEAHQERQYLDNPCITTKRINPQWPLQLFGSPLAFSVAANSFASVATLIQLGASPTAPTQPLENDQDTTWTPVHLAVKCHSAEMITLLLLGSSTLLSHLGTEAAVSSKQRLTKIPFIVECLGGESAPLAKALGEGTKFLKISTTFWDASFGCALSFSTVAERMAMHGVDYPERLTDVIALLPAICLESSKKDGMTPLMQAIDFNDISVVTAILTRYPNLASKPFRDPLDDGQYTYPMHFASQIAARRDSFDALDILKILGQYVPGHTSLLDSSGKTPLHYAVTGPFDRASRWLLENGCPPTTMDKRGHTPLLVAQSTSNIMALLDAGADVDQQDKDGRTALHVAAMNGSEDLISPLLSRGAKIDMMDSLGQTPLHHAVLKRSVEVCTLLLSANALVNAKNMNGDTPLHLLVESYRRDIAQLLLDYGADISIRCDGPDSPTILHKCVFYGDLFCLNWLLAAVQARDPTLIDAADSKKQTPLHKAITIANTSKIRALLKNGADIRMVDEDGNSTLHLAVRKAAGLPTCSQSDRLEVCTLLYKHLKTLAASEGEKPNQIPAEVMLENGQGQRPWDLAYQQGDLMLMEFLLRETGLDACRHLRFNDEYIGESLLERAIDVDEWDLVMALLRKDIIYLHPSLTDWAKSRLIPVLDTGSRGPRENVLQQVFRDSWKEENRYRGRYII